MASSTATGRAISTPAVDRPSGTFRPGLLPTLATLAALLVLLALGTWQVQRLAWKTELIERAGFRLNEPPIDLPVGAVDAGSFDFRRVRATGRFVTGEAMAFGTTARDGVVGGTLLVPLILPDGGVLLTELGWLPDRKAGAGAVVTLPAAFVTIEGVARDRGQARPGWLTPAPDPSTGRWFAWDLPAMGEALGVPLLPIVLTADRPVEGVVGPEPSPVTIDYPNNHLGYAITWYGLAAGLLAVYVAFGRQRGRG